jgi:xanthine dehydrogenase accessory factor
MEIAEAIARGTPKLITFGVSDERAWDVGLACGGTIRVFVEPTVRPEILREARGPGGSVIVTVVEGPALGAGMVMHDDGSESGNLPGELDRRLLAHAARQSMAHGTSTTLELTNASGTCQIFLEAFPRRPTLVVFGGVHIAAALVPLAKRLGYRTVIADGREAFLSRERFPEADELVLAWPEEAFAKLGLDASTYVCVLSHDPKFDEPALEIALRSPAPYVGAIGSRQTQAKRRDRLKAAGFGESTLSRLRGPIGLDLGGREPAEIALAILAEMTAVRYGGTAQDKGGTGEGGKG